MENTIQGVLFDMDGVLVDSEEYIAKAAIQMFAEHGIQAKHEDFLPFVGAGEDAYLGGVAAKYEFAINVTQDKKRTYDIYLELIKGNLKPLPGVREFLGYLRNKKIKTAVATSADYVKMTGNLVEIGLAAETFDAAINGLDVKFKKPAPDIYLKAASRIGLNPKDCLVVEDAVNGVIAAKEAGCRCLALTTSFSADKLRDADWIIPDLSYFKDIPQLLNLF